MTPSDGERSHDVVAGLLRRNANVLLAHRHPGRRWYPNVWDLPGGHIELHEDPLEALHRELREELGIAIVARCEPPALVLHDASLRLRAWIIDEWAGNPANLAPDEHDRIAWFSHTDAETLPLAHPRYAELIGQALRQGPGHNPGALRHP